MTELQALIAELERATEETQHVFVYDALVYAHKRGWLNDSPYDLAMRWTGAGAFNDAALQLLPEGWEYTLNVSKTGCVVNLCPEWNDDSAPVFWSNRLDESDRGKQYKRRFGSSPTPAIAVCIVSLKARQAFCHGSANND